MTVKMFTVFLDLATAAAGASAAAFWLRSAKIPVPDNLDRQTEEFQRIARYNGYAAWCACAAALFQSLRAVIAVAFG
jgi:hypothetical protein